MKAIKRTCFAVAICCLAIWPLPAEETARPSPRILTRNRSFRLPVKIDDRDRAELKELKLFMKTGDSPWSCIETASPQQKSFTYRAPRDGEYCFHIATVDLQERMTPAQPDREPPGIIVVVDTTPPEITVTPVTLASGQSALRCQVEDSHPDEKSLRLELAAAEGWRLLSADAGDAMLFPVADPRALKGKVRVRAGDRAGNTVEKEIDLGSRAAAAKASDARPAVVPKLEPTEVPSLVPTPAARIDPAVAPAVAREPAPDATPIPLLNALKYCVDYQVDGVATISGVEVWLTADGGKSWQLAGEAQALKGAATVQFPGDGVYGYRLVVKTGKDSEASPLSGEAPEGSVEVDTVKPELTLLSAVHAVKSDGGYIHIRWRASDRNLGSEPVSLYYSFSRNGDWALIAERVANTGTYAWKLPNHSGAEVFVRIAVRDRAGNIAQVETRQPIHLDVSKVRARVLGWHAAP